MPKLKFDGNDTIEDRQYALDRMHKRLLEKFYAEQEVVKEEDRRRRKELADMYGLYPGPSSAEQQSRLILDALHETTESFKDLDEELKEIPEATLMEKATPYINKARLTADKHLRKAVGIGKKTLKWIKDRYSE